MTEEELKQILEEMASEIRSRWDMEFTVRYRFHHISWVVEIATPNDVSVRLDVVTDKIDIYIPDQRKRYVKRTSKGTFVITTLSRNVVLFLREAERRKKEREIRRERNKAAREKQERLRNHIYSDAMYLMIRPNYEDGERITLEFPGLGNEALERRLLEKIDSLVTLYCAEADPEQDTNLWKLLNEEADLEESSQEAGPTS